MPRSSLTIFAVTSLLIPVVALAQTPGRPGRAAPPPLNVSGKWEASQAGFYGQMRQSGAVISGRCYQGSDCVIRGAFVGDHVMITANFGHETADKKCRRDTFIAPNTGKLSPLVGTWHGDDYNGPDGLTRGSADPGDLVAYPYADELRECGDIVTYELSFDVNSAVIKNPDAPVLTAMAALLRTDPAVKIRVIGHTDATGDAQSNKQLSVRRAEAVRQRIVQLAATDSSRVATDGMGPDQPLDSNDTPAGRAHNRRVEILIAR
jgi:outer membrane protein OmpA-like peptidoglycan-associated protein